MKAGKGRAAIVHISVRFDRDDIELLDAAAAAAGETRSEFIRQAALGQSIRLRPLRGLLAEASASLLMLRRWYGNASPTGPEHRRMQDEFPKLQRLVRILILACDRPVR